MRLLRSKLFWFAMLLVLICLTMMIYSAATGRRTILTDLTAAVDELQAAVVDGDNAAAKQLCVKVEAALAERNRLCKLNK